MNLRVIEKKVLGALLILANDQMEVKASKGEIAKVMGYKKTGGAITFAIDALEMKNHITILDKGLYKILL